MRFCPTCQRVMARETASGAVMFRCQCGTEAPGTPDDARISSRVFGSTETAEMYSLLIDSAPFDRTDLTVPRWCVDCGRDYMTLVRVGESQTVIYRCQCGRSERGDAAPALVRTTAPAP